jgi:hypothetical protein
MREQSFVTDEHRQKLTELHWYSLEEDAPILETWRLEGNHDTLGFTKVIIYSDRPWECEGDFKAIAELAAVLGLGALPSLLVEREALQERIEELESMAASANAYATSCMGKADSFQERLEKTERVLLECLSYLDEEGGTAESLRVEVRRALGEGGKPDGE